MEFRGSASVPEKEFPLCIKPAGEDFPEDTTWEPIVQDLQSRIFWSIAKEPEGRVRKSLLKSGDDDSETPGYGDTVKLYSRVFNGPVLLAKHLVTYRLGEGSPVKGWDIAVPAMKTNECSIFLIQPPYTEGVNETYPGAPVDCPLLFEMKLMSWNREDLSAKKDKGILRKVIEAPASVNSPNFGAYVTVKITGYYKSFQFDDRDLEFHIGEGCLLDIPIGIEMALLKFSVGEKSRLYLAPMYAFGSDGKPGKSIPPDSLIEYEVILSDFKKAKEIWQMNSDDKWKYSLLANEKGTTMYRVGYFKAALKQFKKVIRFLENEPGVAPEEVERRQCVLLTGYLNAAACYLKLNNSIKAIRVCDKALKIDPSSEKGLFRRGNARLKVHDYDEALQDFKLLLQCHPDNKSAKSKISECQSCISQHKRKEHSLYSNMFKKFAEEDEEKRKQQQNQTETGVWIGQEHVGSANESQKKDEEEDAVVQMLSRPQI